MVINGPRLKIDPVLMRNNKGKSRGAYRNCCRKAVGSNRERFRAGEDASRAQVRVSAKRLALGLFALAARRRASGFSRFSGRLGGISPACGFGLQAGFGGHAVDGGS